MKLFCKTIFEHTQQNSFATKFVSNESWIISQYTYWSESQEKTILSQHFSLLFIVWLGVFFSQYLQPVTSAQTSQIYVPSRVKCHLSLPPKDVFDHGLIYLTEVSFNLLANYNTNIQSYFAECVQIVLQKRCTPYHELSIYIYTLLLSSRTTQYATLVLSQLCKLYTNEHNRKHKTRTTF